MRWSWLFAIGWVTVSHASRLDGEWRSDREPASTAVPRKQIVECDDCVVATVSKILSSSQLKVDPVKTSAGQPLDPAKIYTLRSANDHELVAYVQYAKAEFSSSPQVRILRLLNNRLIVPGDEVLAADLGHVSKIYRGQNSFFIRDDMRVAATYTPPVYYGPIAGQTAATLRSGEQLLDIVGIYGYGVSNRVSVATRLLSWADRQPNLAVKYRVFDTDYATVSPYVAVLGDPVQHKLETTFSLYVDLPSNAKVISHTTLRVTHVTGTKTGSISEILSSSEIRSGYAYVFDNWDRFLFGPSYNFQTKTLGGYLAYMWVWEHLHVVVGLSSADVTRFKVDATGYLPFGLFFWRF